MDVYRKYFLKYISSVLVVLGLCILQSCDRSLIEVLEPDPEPRIRIRGVLNGDVFEKLDVPPIEIEVTDEDVLSKVHVYLLSEEVVLLDSLFQLETADFNYQLPNEFLEPTRENQRYQIIVVAHNTKTFSRFELNFEVFRKVKPTYLQLIWSKNAVHTLDSTFGFISSQQFSHDLVDVAVTPEFPSYVLIDSLGHCELRDIRTHEIIWQKETGVRAPKNSLLSTSENQILLSIASESWSGSNWNKMLFMSNSGDIIKENSGAHLTKEHYTNIVKGTTFYIFGGELYSYQGISKSRRYGWASFVTGNGNDKYYSLFFSNRLFSVAQHDESYTPLLSGNNLLKKDILDFCATAKNLLILEKEKIRGFDIETLQEVQIKASGTQLYSNYHDDIPYLISGNQLFEIDEDNFTLKEVYKASETLQGMETLHIHKP